MKALLPSLSLQAIEIVLARIVVLVRHSDLRVGLVLKQVLGVDPRLGLIVSLPTHGPREAQRVAPVGRPGGNEQVGHLVGVEILVDRRVRWSAQGAEREHHFILLDKLTDLLDGLRRAVAVVDGDRLDLAAVDASLVVDHREVRRLGLANRGIRGERAAVGHRLPDLYLSVADAGVIFFLATTTPDPAKRETTSTTRKRMAANITFSSHDSE
jgi:hypothetical protein